MLSLRSGQERRSLQPTVVGSYSPGIKRVEDVAVAELIAHDLEFKGTDPEKYQAWYDLYEHCEKVRVVMRKLGEAAGLSQPLIDVGCTAALLHDVGKTDQRCHVYRKNGPLTKLEYMDIDKHPDFSSSFVLDQMPHVRKQDWIYLSRVNVIILHHHKPWRIRNPVLRNIAWRLKLDDFFISGMENRHRPGRSQFQSIKKVKSLIEGNDQRFMPDRVRKQFADEIWSAFKLLDDRYGKPRFIK